MHRTAVSETAVLSFEAAADGSDIPEVNMGPAQINTSGERAVQRHRKGYLDPYFAAALGSAKDLSKETLQDEAMHLVERSSYRGTIESHRALAAYKSSFSALVGGYWPIEAVWREFPLP